ncbi:unnamed protein product [Soboliphyme baturini]|uniref:START domain-containing protein n=1 Tax=Soboliphyme baturini TaxID=241478 RepID=A0A183J0Z4_9BILA|nr:unnamed protein product [Soboliphyme baturini]
MYLYTPTDARSFFEEATFRQHWPTVDGLFVPGRNLLKNKECTVIAKASDRGNVIRAETLAAVIRLNDFIANDMKVMRCRR